MKTTQFQVIVCTIFFLTFVGCSGGGDESASEAESGPAVLLRVEISPHIATVPSNVVLQYSAIAIYSDNTTVNVTDSATWYSSDSSVLANLSPSNKGEMRTGTPGNVTLTAVFESKTGSTAASVTPATLTSIELSPLNSSIAKGFTQSFSATGRYSDNSTADLTQTVTWSSSNTLVASVSNASGSRGFAATHTLGTANIRATLGSVTRQTSLTVTAATLQSISVTPAYSTIALGTSTQLQATGHYSDGSTLDLTSTATWTSSSALIAAVGNSSGTKGNVDGRGIGSSIILAAYQSVSGQTAIDVSSAELVSIAVSPATSSIPTGLSQQLTVTGTYTDGSTQDVTASAVFSSSNLTVAAADNGSGFEGLVHALSLGSAVITADVSGISANVDISVTAAQLVSIDVTPNIASVPLGLVQNFLATGTYTDGATLPITHLVTWSSSSTSVATISNASGHHGKAQTVATGTVTVTAALDSVIGTADLSVDPAELVSIAITPSNSSAPLGGVQQFTATGLYSDGTSIDVTSSATWHSDEPSVSHIDSSGLLQTLSEGSSVISATIGSVFAQTNHTVTPF